jgi:hypothetical protein
VISTLYSLRREYYVYQIVTWKIVIVLSSARLSLRRSDAKEHQRLEYVPQV